MHGLQGYVSVVQVDAFGNHRLNPTAPGPRNFTIGDTFITGAGSVLNVRGDMLGAGNSSGEVFGTDAPGGTQTSWRLFNGGVQYGAVFNSGVDSHFEQDAITKGGHLRWRTNFHTLYMQLLGLQFSSINGYSIDQTGYLGLGDPDDWDVTGPYSRIHLIDRISGGSTNQCAQPEPFRDWMRNGITMSGNYDLGYIGQKYAPSEGSDIADDDHTDMVLHWGNDTGEDEALGPDLLRFLFTTARESTATSGAQSEAGLEAIRLFPKSNTSVNVGIGDFYAYGLDP